MREKTTSLLCGVFAAAVALLALGGWLIKLPVLTKFFEPLPSMSPNTALAVVVLAISLILAVRGGGFAWARITGGILAASVVVFAFLTFLQFATGFDLGLQNQILPFVNSSGTASQTAISLAVLGCALLLRHRTGDKTTITQHIFALIGLVICFGVLTGYVFQVRELYAAGSRLGIALPTVAAIVLLSTGIIALQFRRGLGGVLVSGGITGRLVRQLLPITAAILLAANLIRLELVREEIISLELGVALAFIISFLLIVGATFWFASMVSAVERKQIETSAILIESQERFNAFMNHIPLGAWILDERGGVIYQNKYIDEVTGSELAESKGKTPHDIFPPEKAEEHFADDMSVLREGKIIEKVFILPDRTGAERETLFIKFPIIHATGEKYVGVVLLDITDQRRIEVALRESENRFRTFMDSSPTAAFMKDEKGYYRFINRLMTEMYHVTTESLRGKTDEDWLPPEVAAEVRANDLIVLENGQPIKMLETVPTPEGEMKHWLTLKFPFINDAGERFVGGVAVDVTEQKVAEDRLAKSLAEKETLLKEVHHRVKNNLQVISSLINLQQRKLELPLAVAAFGELKQRVQTMSLIHEKLYQSDNLAEIDLAAYLKDLTAMVFQTYRASSRNISMQNSGESVKVSIEKALPCGLIVNELISNSLKYAFKQKKKGCICVDLVQTTENRICLTVSDDGDGLPPDFELSKTDSLGLKVVKSLVGQLNATLEINRMQGANFTLAFDI